MANNINSYIRQLLDKGYSLSTIRSQLLNAGYNEKDIDSAINYVYSHPYTIKKKGFPKFSRKKILVGGGIALAAVLIVLLVFTVFPSSSKNWLRLGITSQAEEVRQGEELSFMTDLTNAGKAKQYSIFLTHEISNANTGSLLTIKTETVSLETSTSHPSFVKIPADSKLGGYTLTTTAVFLDQKVTKNLFFSVKKREVVATCTDLIQNQGEEGVDCGGPCAPCGIDSSETQNGTTTTTDTGLGPTQPQQTVLPPGAASLDHDNDGIPNIYDSDDDNDEIIDTDDDYPYDFDNDGIADIDDPDDDNDGIVDADDSYPYDFDNDGITTRPGPPVQLSTELGGTPATAQCPNSCNDYDICTEDICINGLCQHLSKSPCCGDFICEDEETSTSCPQDCAAQPISGTKTAADIIQEAVEKAPTNPEAAALTCYGLALESDADECFFQVADAADETAICEQISDERKRDSCYMNKLLENNDLTVCDKLANQIVQRTCYSLVNIRSQEQLFEELTGAPPSIPTNLTIPGTTV